MSRVHVGLYELCNAHLDRIYYYSIGYSCIDLLVLLGCGSIRVYLVSVYLSVNASLSLSVSL